MLLQEKLKLYLKVNCSEKVANYGYSGTGRFSAGVLKGWKELVKFKTDSDITEDISKIISSTEAEQYIQDYTEYIMFIREDINSREEARKVAEGNIGYLAGYLDSNKRYEIEHLFNVEHPVFGSIDKMGYPTSEEAFECGMQRITLKELRDNK